MNKEKLWSTLKSPLEDDRSCDNCTYDPVRKGKGCNIKTNDVLCCLIEGWGADTSWEWNGEIIDNG